MINLDMIAFNPFTDVIISWCIGDTIQIPIRGCFQQQSAAQK